jgi:dolichol kinase
MEKMEKEKHEKQAENTDKNIKVSEQIQEQLNLISNQIVNIRSLVQSKTHNFVENAKLQIFEATKRIEAEVHNIKEDATIIEMELLNSQKKVADQNISFGQELARKMFHLTSLIIPIFYISFSKEFMLMFLVPLMILVVITDIATKRFMFLRSIYLRIFGIFLREHEIKTNQILLNGASWFLISAVLTIFIFPKLIAIIGLTILIISDLLAAIFGRKFGKHKFSGFEKLGLGKKSWEGTAAFFVSAMLIIIFYGIFFGVPFQFYFIGIIAAIVAAGAEVIAKNVLQTDDNLAIPISFGIIMWTGNAFLNYFWQIDCISILL